MSDEPNSPNPLIPTGHDSPLSIAQRRLSDLRSHWAQHGILAFPSPVVPQDPLKPGREWFPEPEWISGWSAFEIFRLQAVPYTWAPAIARICETITDQVDRDATGLNYVLGSLPPDHELLKDFPRGSNHWFRALYDLLTLQGADQIEGWESLVSNLYDWLGPYDNLRIRSRDVLERALSLSWAWHEYSLPEAKQEPIWSFPDAMAWIATRDYLAKARMGYFRRPDEDDEAAATDGVCRHNTKALGWLHTVISFAHCECGALSEFRLEAYKHCTCVSIAWEELVRFMGGLSPVIPELVFNLQEGWLSMTWPDGAEDIRFLRRDILDRWPARPVEQPQALAIEQSTIAGERDCRRWLAQEFADDHEKRRSKKDFRGAALAAFPGRLSERGFNLRVWPSLAREHGRDGAGAKKKS